MSNPLLLIKNNKLSIGGKAAYRHRMCPYATEDVTERVPSAERTAHSDTEGAMVMAPGPNGYGWKCLSNECPFFLGTATTEVEQSTLELTCSSGHMYYNETMVPILVCSGKRFFEY